LMFSRRFFNTNAALQKQILRSDVVQQMQVVKEEFSSLDKTLLG